MFGWWIDQCCKGIHKLLCIPFSTVYLQSLLNAALLLNCFPPPPEVSPMSYLLLIHCYHQSWKIIFFLQACLDDTEISREPKAYNCVKSDYGTKLKVASLRVKNSWGCLKTSYRHRSCAFPFFSTPVTSLLQTRTETKLTSFVLRGYITPKHFSFEVR